MHGSKARLRAGFPHGWVALPKIGGGITVEKIIVCPFPMSTVLMITYADTSEGRIYYTTRVLEMSRPLATGPLMTSVSSVYSDVTGLVRDTGPAVAKPPPPHLQRRIESQTASTSVDQGQGSALPPFDRPAAPSSDGETTSASFQPPAVSPEGSGVCKYVAVAGQRYLQLAPQAKAAPKALPLPAATYTRYTGAGAEHRNGIVICGFAIIMACEGVDSRRVVVDARQQVSNGAGQELLF